MYNNVNIIYNIIINTNSVGYFTEFPVWVCIAVFLCDHTTGLEAYPCSRGIVTICTKLGACHTHNRGQVQTSLHKSWLRQSGRTEKLSLTLRQWEGVKMSMGFGEIS